MATGPEHYAEAEQSIAMATEQMAAIAANDPTAGLRSEAIFWLQTAQVHATLALAAATALVTPEPSDERIAVDPIVAEWWRVAS